MTGRLDLRRILEVVQQMNCGSYVEPAFQLEFHNVAGFVLDTQSLALLNRFRLLD